MATAEDDGDDDDDDDGAVWGRPPVRHSRSLIYALDAPFDAFDNPAERSSSSFIAAAFSSGWKGR